MEVEGSLKKCWEKNVDDFFKENVGFNIFVCKMLVQHFVLKMLKKENNVVPTFLKKILQHFAKCWQKIVNGINIS
jgi:hypothetical protein